MSLDFTKSLDQFLQESGEIQKEEVMLKEKARLHQEKFFAWLKESGLPENFTLPKLMQVAINKARDM